VIDMLAWLELHPKGLKRGADIPGRSAVLHASLESVEANR